MSCSVRSVTSATPLTTPQTSWNPVGANGVSQATRPVRPTHRGPSASCSTRSVQYDHPCSLLPRPGLLGQQALAGQAAGVVRGLQVGMHQRGARGRQVVAVDRTPGGRRVQPPHRVGVPDHGGQGVPDQGWRQLVQVQEMPPGIVDAHRAVGGVRHDVGHHHCLAHADAALGRELGGKRDRGLLQVLAVERAEGRLRGQVGHVRPAIGAGASPRSGSGRWPRSAGPAATAAAPGSTRRPRLGRALWHQGLVLRTQSQPQQEPRPISAVSPRSP